MIQLLTFDESRGELQFENCDETDWRLVARSTSSANNLASTARACIAAARKRRGFGVSLENKDTNALKVFNVLIEDLKKRGVVDGIFRLSASASELRKLRLQLEQLSPNDVDFAEYSVHTTAGALKCWLRELPSPLLPYGVYRPLLVAHEDFIAVQSDDENENDNDVQNDDNDGKEILTKQQKIEQHQKRLKMILGVLPENNRKVLQQLLILLNELSKHNDVTRMNSSNLAIVIAPNILYAQVQTHATTLEMPGVAGIVSFLIDQHEHIL